MSIIRLCSSVPSVPAVLFQDPVDQVVSRAVLTCSFSLKPFCKVFGHAETEASSVQYVFTMQH
jgi:hypothetical protein